MAVPAFTHSHAGKRTRWILTASVLGIIAVIVGWTQLTKPPYTILVDGKPIVTVESRGAAKRILSDLRQLGEVPDESTRFTQSVTMRKASDSAEITDLPEATKRLQPAVNVEARLFAIVVNGKPIVSLANESSAQQTLDLLKRKYQEQTSSNPSETSFKEAVSVAERHVPMSLFRRSPEEALSVLTSPSEQAVYHKVAPGDRAVHIALRYGISVQQLKSLNPDADLNRLSDGDTLLVQTPRLPITVVTKSLVDRTTTVEHESGRRRGRTSGGKRHTKAYIVYENGKQADEQLISQLTTWQRPSGSTRGSRYDEYNGSSDDDGYDSNGRRRRHYHHYRHYRSSRHAASSSPDQSGPGAGVPSTSTPGDQ